VRTDGSHKPAYEALHDLIRREWWLPPTLTGTDADGWIRFEGFLGDYSITGQGRTAAVRLDRPGPATLQVRLV
jgi:hypothetical protein